MKETGNFYLVDWKKEFRDAGLDSLLEDTEKILQNLHVQQSDQPS